MIHGGGLHRQVAYKIDACGKETQQRNVMFTVHVGYVNHERELLFVVYISASIKCFILNPNAKI